MSENKEVSQRQEQHIAAAVCGKVVPGSGCGKFSGGDVLTQCFFIEAKTPTTERSSFAIKKQWIEKCKEQAYQQGKEHWSLAFEFEPNGANYYIIDEMTMCFLVEQYQELRNLADNS